MKFIIAILLVCMGCSSAPQPQISEAKPEPTTSSYTQEEPCDIDPTQCFSWEAQEEKGNRNDTVIPTPLIRNNDKPRKLK